MRKDFQIITDLIPKYAKILDIGCGDGTLLSHLKNQKQIIGRGIELNARNVTTAISNGIPVIQGDADTDLYNYPDDAVDLAILSQTLQVTKNPKEILKEMMRISKYAIISVPNFGYIENRLYLSLSGRMPVTKSLSYQWHDTPNIHFCTLRDFESLATEVGFHIEKKVFLNDSSFLPNEISHSSIANLFSKQGIYLLSRPTKINYPSKKRTNSLARIGRKVALSSRETA